MIIMLETNVLEKAFQVGFWTLLMHGASCVLFPCDHYLIICDCLIVISVLGTHHLF